MTCIVPFHSAQGFQDAGKYKHTSMRLASE
jgi:hypothetical protein